MKSLGYELSSVENKQHDILCQGVKIEVKTELSVLGEFETCESGFGII